MQTVEQLKAIGDVMLHLGDLRKAEIIHDAVKLCTVWHRATDELPEKGDQVTLYFDPSKLYLVSE